MKKRMLLSLCAAVLSALLLLAAFPAAALAVETIVLAAGEPYITAIAGETVDLTRYAVTLNGATAAPESLVWKNGGQAVSSFTPAGAGVYPLTAESGSASATIYVVAKNESDAEYVLYANDFADADALSGLRFITGGAALCEIEDGALVLDATTLNGPEVAVLLPEWLDDFGSYRVEASVAVRNTADDSCWSSLTFRTQSDGQRCYQMLVRRNAAAADGLRLRMRTIAQEWQTLATARAGSALNEGEYHTYAVEVKGSAMRGCLDDVPLLYSNALSAYSEGGLGLCVQYGRMYVDELRVTVQENTPTQPADPALTETSKVSPVASALGFYAVYNSGSIEACLTGAQGVVVSVDEELRVCETSGGTPVYTLDELFAKLDGNVFPIFTPYGDADIARPLALYLKYANRADAAYMDSDGDAIRTAREIYPYLRGIYRAEAGMTASAITDAALTATAQTAALPTALCTQETVAALQSALLTVATCPTATNETALMDAAASGANIVIAPSASAARNAAASLGSTTTTRAPLLIGAAGSPSLAPENSLSSFSAAVNAGAGAILADVRLTADGVPVIMKDETIDRTTSGSGRVGAMTLNAIKQYKLWGENNAFSGSHPNETVPSLAELLQRFRTSQTRILLDLRSTEPELAQAVADCIEQQGMTGRVVCISTNAYTLTTLRAALPGLQCALKLGAPGVTSITNSVEDELVKQLAPALRASAQLYINYGNVTSEYIAAANARGVSLILWEYVGGSTAMAESYRSGAAGLCTSDVQTYTASGVKYIAANRTEMTIGSGQPVFIGVFAYGHDGRATEITLDSACSAVFLSGAQHCTIANGRVTPKSVGTSVVRFRYVTSMPDGSTLTLYSRPVTITVQSVTQYGVIQLKSSSEYLLDPSEEYNIVVGEKVTLSAYLSNFTNSDLIVLDSEGKPFTGSYITTGCTVNAYVDGVLADRYVIVVVGDVNGDGLLTSSDYLLLKRHIVVEEALSGAYLKAGDINLDGKVTASDYLLLKQQILDL